MTTTTGDGPKTTGTDASGPEIRRIPAHVGVIDHSPVEPGRPAQAGQPGDVRPSESALVGDASGGWPAAAKKTADAAQPASKAPAQKAPVDTTPPPLPAPKAAPVRKTGFWPVAFGGAVAAGLGAAATIYALPHLPAGWLPQDSAPAAVQQAPDQQAMIDAASDAGRTAALAALSDAPADDTTDQLAARVDALEQQITELSAAPEPQPAGDDQPADPQPQQPAIDPDQLAQLQQRLDDQQARLDELAARPAFDPEAANQAQQQIEATAAEVQSRLDAAQTQAQELQDAAAESTRRAQAVAAIAALQSALDRGVTPDQAREALTDAGLDTPEALQAQIPSLTELQTDFPEAARAALRASLRDTSASGEGNLFTNFLRAQTGARSVAPRDGDDPDAILSRADAEVQAGRIDAALTQAQALPEPARAAPAMADWLSRATAYSQAQAALSDLSSGTN